MPKIPTIGFQTRPAGPVNQPRASAGALGAEAAGMRQLGQTLGAAGQVVQNVAEQRDMFEAELQYVENEQVARERLRQLQAEAPEGGVYQTAEGEIGFADKARTEFNDWLPSAMEKAPRSLKAQRALRAKYARLESGLMAEAQLFEAEARTAQQLRRFSEAQVGAMNTVRGDPGRLFDILEQNEALVASAPFPNEQVRAEQRNISRQAILNSGLDGWVARFETDVTDPEQVAAAAEALKAGAYGFKDLVDPKVYDQALTRLEKRRNGLDVESVANFGKDIADAKVTIQNHGYIPENITYARALQVYKGDEKAARRVMDELNSDMRVYGHRQRMADTDFTQDQALLQQMHAAAQGEGAAYKQQDWQEVARAVQEKWQAIGEDMTGHLLQTNPGLAEARAAALSMPNGTPEERAARQAALDGYYTRLEALLGTTTLADGTKVGYGLPKYVHRIIPKSEARDLVARLQGMGAEDVADEMARLAVDYGPRYPLAMRQLQEMGVDPTAIELGSLVGVGDAGLRKKLAGYMQTGQSELRKAIGGTHAAEIDSFMVEALAPFNATLSGTRDGLDIIGRKTEAVRTLAYGIYMDGGVKPKEAVTRAFNQLIGNRWDTAATFLTPKGMLGATERAAATILARTTPDKFAPVGRGSMDPATAGTEADRLVRQQAAYVTARTQGKWLNSPDGNGVMLFVPDGPGSATYSPLKLADGSFLEVRFSELRKNPDAYAADTLESGRWAVVP